MAWNEFELNILFYNSCYQQNGVYLIWLIFNNIKTGFTHFINMNYHNSSINTLYYYNTFKKYTNMAGSVYSLYIQKIISMRL